MDGHYSKEHFNDVIFYGYWIDVLREFFIIGNKIRTNSLITYSIMKVNLLEF